VYREQDTSSCVVYAARAGEERRQDGHARLLGPLRKRNTRAENHKYILVKKTKYTHKIFQWSCSI